MSMMASVLMKTGWLVYETDQQQVSVEVEYTGVCTWESMGFVIMS